MSRTLLLTGWQRVITAHSCPARRAHALAAHAHAVAAALRVYTVHCREEEREKRRGLKRRGVGGKSEVLEGEEAGAGGASCLIIIISSASMKAVFFASHPEVNHPRYNPCICSTTLHFIGHLEVRL